MFKITFKNVGRNKANFEVLHDNEPDYLFLLNQVRRHLASTNIDFSDNGHIYAGFHHVGDFTVEKAE